MSASRVVTNGAPTVAVVGRPNVGKSTLVNRIVGRREAIVEEQPGVTRDRKILDAEWVGRAFMVVDTGGWLRSDEPLARQVSLQAERAIDESDVVVLVVDGAVGPTDEDAQVASILRRSSKPVLLAVNKVDDANREPDAWSFTRLGLGDPIPVSALHGRGSGELLDLIVEQLPPEPEVVAEETVAHGGLPPEDGIGSAEKPFSVAIVGRPNVGKSTLFNRLVGEERAVVHDAPGTTRDTIDTVVETEDGWLRFVDTAGMRRKSRIDEGTEYYDFSPDRAREILGRVVAALPPGGRVLILEIVPDDERRSPPLAVAFSVAMIVNTTGGDAHTVPEYRSWLEEAGLADVVVTPLEGRMVTTVIEATRP